MRVHDKIKMQKTPINESIVHPNSTDIDKAAKMSSCTGSLQLKDLLNIHPVSSGNAGFEDIHWHKS
jgi:hypothetical protein